jgi:hypothetical protein
MVSDGELIKMLSTFKDTRSIQPYLQCVFENVAKFEFNSQADKDLQRS